MTVAEILAVIAVLLCAAAVLPGSLGVLMLTNKIAVSEPGARYIYGSAFWVLMSSLLVALAAIVLAIGDGSYASWIFIASVVAYGAILVFGFFMHTKLMFRPVRKPKFMSVDAAVERFGPDEEVVGVVDNDGRPFAFIARLARRPHIVYQPEGENPFIMTHCILAHSSMSYALEDRFRQPEISITAALANNMVFYDKASQCSVIQLHNQSLDKSMPLATIPTVAVKLSTWKTLYPDSQVWYRNLEWRDMFYLKLLARADVIDPKSPTMVYPLQNPLDERLPMKSMVIGVQAGGATRTYPLDAFDAGPVINDELGGVPLVLVSAVGGDYVQVFDRRVAGQALNFRPAGEGDDFADIETGSVWSPTGECLSGEHQGTRLDPVPHYNKIFWYVWSDFHPGTEIYGRPSSERHAA